MARKKITADLNGGDAVTAMADLVFQVHDASDDSIIATANYAAIGSVNTNGTDGANIVYTLNPTGGAGSNGQIILDGVDIGAVTSVKIRCKDTSGNESILSAGYSVYLFEDDFAGTSIDAAKWDISNAGTPDFVISQNNVLLMTNNGTGLNANFSQYVHGKPAFTLTEPIEMLFDMSMEKQNGVASEYWRIGITPDAIGEANDNFIGLQGVVAAAGQFDLVDKKAAAYVTRTTITQTISALTSFKITIDAATITWYYWNGTVWTSLGSAAHTHTGSWKPLVNGNSTATATNLMTVDNMSVAGVLS